MFCSKMIQSATVPLKEGTLPGSSDALVCAFVQCSFVFF